MRINSLVDAETMAQESFALPEEESHHLSRVLRVEPGQEITVFDGQGGVADAVVEAAGKRAVEMRVLRRRQVPRPAAQIDLFQALPKPDRWETVLQKAVELGAANIHPLLSRHVEHRAGEAKAGRWRKIVLNAAQQCEVRWLPQLHPVRRFDEILPLLGGYDLALVASLQPGAVPFRDVPLAGKRSVALLIGPEGDFAPEEIEAAVAAGATPVSFGERILRTETAAIFGLSVLAYGLL